MKKNVFVVAVLLGCLSILLAGITGCGLGVEKPDALEDGLEPPPPIAAFDTSEAVHQVWLVPGNKPQDLDAVYAEVNKFLKEEINATIELKHVPWQTFVNQAETLLAADSPPDAMMSFSWSGYARLAAKGLLAEIDSEQVSRYAPKMSAALSAYTDKGLAGCTVAGKSYMLPAAGNLWVEDYPVLIRGDLRASHGLSEVITLDDLDAYLKALAEAQTGIVPWNADGNGLYGYLQLAWYQPNGMDAPVNDLFFLASSLGDKRAQIRNVLDDKSFADALLRLHSLASAGAVPESAFYTRTPAQQSWVTGQSACLIADLETVSNAYVATLRDHPEWKAEWCLLNSEAKRVRQPVNSLRMVMPVGAGNPERFLMTMDLLFGTKELQDLTLAGLPGTNRAAGSGNVYEPGPDAKKYPFNETGSWAWMNRDLMMAPSAAGWLQKEIYDKWTGEEGRVVEAELGAFQFDPTPVATQLSAIQTALGTEGRFLLAGVSDNLSTDMKTLQDALSEAGAEDVRVEMQRQADLFLAGQ